MDEIITPNDLYEFQVGKKYGDITIHVTIRLRMDSFTYDLQWKRKEKHLTARTLPGCRLYNRKGNPSVSSEYMNLLHNKRDQSLFMEEVYQIDSGFHFDISFGIDGLSKNRL